MKPLIALFIVLGIFALALGGLAVYESARVTLNAVHEIEGMVMILIGVVALGFAGVLAAAIRVRA